MLYTEEDLQRSYAEGYNAACDELEAMIEESECEFSLVQESKKHSKKDEEEDLTALESALLEAQK